MKQYGEVISGFFSKPKEKDQYDRQYDKGKTKKIKKKVEYVRPDFNKIYKEVKDQQNDDEKTQLKQQYEKEQYGKKR